jgi:hypothetical protein
MQESFDGLKQEMDDACEFMRSFTLGRRGFTRRDGATAIGRVRDLCVRMQEGFDSGRHGNETAQAVTSARRQILAAQARLDLLRR